MQQCNTINPKNEKNKFQSKIENHPKKNSPITVSHCSHATTGKMAFPRMMAVKLAFPQQSNEKLAFLQLSNEKLAFPQPSSMKQAFHLQ